MAARKPGRKNAFYAQSGGVTAVINASACGVIETARAHRDAINRVAARPDLSSDVREIVTRALLGC